MRWLVAACMVLVSVSGCVETPETSVELDEAVELKWGSRLNDCRSLRTFLTLDAEATQAFLPAGFTAEPNSFSGGDVGGVLDIHQCFIAATGESGIIASVSAYVTADDHSSQFDRYRLDMLVSSESLQSVFANVEHQVTLATMDLSQSPEGFTFSAEADGLVWSASHFRGDTPQDSDGFGYTSSERLHHVANGWHGWTDIVGEEFTGALGAAPFNFGKAVVQMEGGNTPNLQTPGTSELLYSLDWGFAGALLARAAPVAGSAS